MKIAPIDDPLERIVAEHLLDLSYEVYEEFSNPQSEYGDIDWAWQDLTPTHIEVANDGSDDPSIGIEAMCEGTTSRQIRKAIRNPPSKAHPAEYENIDLLIVAYIEYFPQRGLGEAHITVRNEGEM